MTDISIINNKMWDIGSERSNVIRPLAESKTCTSQMILQAANELNLSERYVYKLIDNYRRSNGLATSLIPQKPNGGKGGSRLSETQEYLINDIIEKYYLTSQKRNAAAIIEEVRKQCFSKNIEIPGSSTIRRRITDLSMTQLQRRKEDNKSIEPIIGSFPKVDYPLSVVQIDHTVVDIIIVDPIDRLPIGRPYITIAIDIYSRCIAGFVLSLEPPSAVSVGLCLTHIAMDKTPWLALLGIDASWPIYGKPELIHVDNGSDFHSEALTRGCAQHGIKIEYRPPGKVHYGGIVERIIGTMMKLVHDLPGTTFSNIVERGKYPSDTKACLTLAELEHWFIITITKYYHCKLHKGIEEIPIKRYEAGLALMKQAGKKLISINNAKSFLIDFLPIIYRSLKRNGFTLDHIVYYSNALSSFIVNKDKYGKLLIRRDPRDLSRIYVHLPEEQGYLEVSYRNISNPAISLFEHRIALKRIRAANKEQVHEVALFKAIDEIRDIVAKASTKTRAMRRSRTRITENSKIQAKQIQAKKISYIDEPAATDNSTDAFTNIELWE